MKIKQVYSHRPVSEERWYERHITVQDGSFERVIAIVYKNPDQDSAVENADMIVDSLNLAQEREPFMNLTIDKQQQKIVLSGHNVRWTADMKEKILANAITELGWTPPASGKE